MKRVELIKAKVLELKNLDKRFAIFGSSRHKYEWNKTLRKSEINQIESENQIVLSNDYKEILENLGNGGAGPGYGLERLNLEKVNPPYIGSEQLLRNWEDPNNIDCDMVDSDEISGTIKLFDYGCGMENCLIVKGKEIGDIIFFDCDDRFEKIKNKNLLDIYESWLNYNLEILKRVETKLKELTLKEVIDTEWEQDNFSVNEMISSLIGAEPIRGGHSGGEKKIHLEKEYEKWKNRNE